MRSRTRDRSEETIVAKTIVAETIVAKTIVAKTIVAADLQVRPPRDLYEPPAEELRHRETGRCDI
jgi:hypothetical protein